MPTSMPATNSLVRQPGELRTLEVGLFDAYKRIQRIDVQVVGPKGQAKATLKRPARKVQLVR